ncbi:MAG: thiazole biosynthesis family protein, partial [Bacteroidetes bacterium]|nr:thiazole biosynthesis family protein [Bacteroidota bacterium]
MQALKIADHTFTSRLFTGTGKFASLQLMEQALLAAATQLVTVALKRVDIHDAGDDMLRHLQAFKLMPNTSGVRTAHEAVYAAQLAREALETNWVKLEIHPDPRYLMPDPIETLKAAEELVKLGFVVLPYVHADPVLCKRLEQVGVAAVMPLGAPIGSNKGLRTADFLEIIIEQSNIPVVVDAGIGSPSDAAKAMEMGADAVLVNTAIAVAKDPVAMAQAFATAVVA